MPHTERYKKYQFGRSSIIFYLYDLSTFFLPDNPGKHPMTIRFVSRRQLQQPCLPRCILGARGVTALHRAADGGHAAVVEQLISAGAKLDAADINGRGPGRVFGSFWAWLWRGEARGSYMGS